MHPTVQQIARQLREARVARGMSQSELGERVGITQAQISRFEGGRADLTLESLVELGRGLGVEVVLVPRGKVRAALALGLTGPAAAAPGARRTADVDRDGARRERVDG